MEQKKHTPNSHKYKENLKNKKTEKVTKGKVTKKKTKTKFLDLFMPEDMTSIKDFLIDDILIPSVKKIISDSVDMFLYGGSSDHGRSSHISDRISYRSFYDKRDDRGRKKSRRGTYNYEDPILESRRDAEHVLERLDEIIDQYDVVSVLDLYDLCGLETNPTDDDYGWTNIRNAKIVREKNGFMIKMPKLLPID